MGSPSVSTVFSKCIEDSGYGRLAIFHHAELYFSNQFCPSVSTFRVGWIDVILLEDCTKRVLPVYGIN